MQNTTAVQIIVTEIIAGQMKSSDGQSTVFASVSGVQPFSSNDQREGNFSYGSPVIKIKLIDPDTGNPNVRLAEDLRKANVYLQEIILNCRTKITKSGMTFQALSADYPDAVKKAS